MRTSLQKSLVSSIPKFLILDRNTKGDPMNDNHNDALRSLFSPAVAAQIEQGNKLEAIKLLREETGMSLIEAKDLIDSADAQNPALRAPQPQGKIVLSSVVLDKLMQGNKIEAIKTLRDETGLGLKEAKDTVEQGLLDHPEVKMQYDVVSKQGRKSSLLKIAGILLAVYIAYRLFAGG
jgi:ribosomal protein L7/L12